MNAIKFVEGYSQMCCYYDCCYECPLKDKPCAMANIAPGDAEKIVAIVEKWVKEHPPMTNRQKFKEIFGVDAADTAMEVFHSAWLDKEYKAPEDK